ncbi:Ku protein [Bacillus marinisedimentorum]|uniref:non-homologous end joining protein Ku n=1 Tax=Bacillus marinisedimentorum TaxID=1821260 RepID=UPI0007DE6100|nr:Ku protein [Bacillus marinisedimentorum]
MHTIWKGAISFGLVNIPIKLYAATEDKDIKLRSLHKEDHSPIKYEKVCPACEKTLSMDDIVKGYEYEKGKFVVLQEEDFEELKTEEGKTIEIIDFVDLKEIDPIFFNRSYFLGPNENGAKPYTLLKQAMEDSGKIGISKINIRSKQHLAVVRVYEKSLVLETIFFPDEVRNADHIPALPESADLNEKELKMAIQLIEQLTAPFEPEKYKDDYRESLMDVIQQKISGEDIKVAKKAPKKNVADLMEALQASIDETKPKQKKKKAPAKRKKASSS